MRIGKREARANYGLAPNIVISLWFYNEQEQEQVRLHQIRVVEAPSKWLFVY